MAGVSGDCLEFENEVRGALGSCGLISGGWTDWIVFWEEVCSNSGSKQAALKKKSRIHLRFLAESKMEPMW